MHACHDGHAIASHEVGTQLPWKHSVPVWHVDSRHARSRQCSPRHTCAALQWATLQSFGTHAPSAHAWPAPQVLPHVPQFESSLDGSRHASPQTMSPALQCTPPSRGTTRTTGSKQPASSSALHASFLMARSPRTG
jgi:hypothetical protein